MTRRCHALRTAITHTIQRHSIARQLFTKLARHRLPDHHISHYITSSSRRMRHHTRHTPQCRRRSRTPIDIPRHTHPASARTLPPHCSTAGTDTARPGRRRRRTDPLAPARDWTMVATMQQATARESTRWMPPPMDQLMAPRTVSDRPHTSRSPLDTYRHSGTRCRRSIRTAMPRHSVSNTTSHHQATLKHRASSSHD